jgi:hypothetical protein
MEKIQPTPAEVEDFWERCDLYAEERGAWSGKKFYSWFAPNKLFICDDAPPIDLNNLFRYAVPKVEEANSEATVYILHQLCEAVYHHQDPALALFWAIWSVFHA